jgi:hypothetical protein
MAYNPDFNGGNTSEDRYEAGVKSAIQINAAKGKFKIWIAEDDHQELFDWLVGSGPFENLRKGEWDSETHPLCKGMFSGDFGDFLITLKDNIFNWGSLSPKQTDVVRKALARAKDRLAKKEAREKEWEKEAAEAPPVPETDERIDIIAEILSIKTTEGRFGFQTKALYKTQAGYKLWGSLPSAIYDAEKGDCVQFSAKVTRSNDDPSFGFISRPTKAKMLSGGSEEDCE